MAFHLLVEIDKAKPVQIAVARQCIGIGNETVTPNLRRPLFYLTRLPTGEHAHWTLPAAKLALITGYLTVQHPVDIANTAGHIGSPALHDLRIRRSASQKQFLPTTHGLSVSVVFVVNLSSALVWHRRKLWIAKN